MEKRQMYISGMKIKKSRKINIAKLTGCLWKKYYRMILLFIYMLFCISDTFLQRTYITFIIGRNNLVFINSCHQILMLSCINE